MRRFYDERGHCVTEEQLRNEYDELILEGNTEYAEVSFDKYLNNCLSDSNGTLTEVKA